LTHIFRLFIALIFSVFVLPDLVVMFLCSIMAYVERKGKTNSNAI